MARRTNLRWDRRATAVALSGACALVASIVTELVDPGVLDPSTFPLVAPTLPIVMVIGLASTLIPLFVAPRFEASNTGGSDTDKGGTSLRISKLVAASTGDHR